MSQQELADRLQTNQPAVAYWERSASNLRSDIIVKLAQQLNVSADELLGINPAPSQSKLTAGSSKIRRLFEAISKLPRRQQEKIFDLLQPFVKEHLSPSERS